ncbi:hypothetical protein M408DRAFT_331746 [Serendipita vermifera MAFF 305830]|uniref:Nucleolar complex protein 2 n=1 Tax=Serendipita vermifera MAFF 305830 TaxID=933852 RepID=A0A0C2WDG2_SERVB|nr:hypothetical protein M408DRAFT_331746 [Serendipita vermifera MAFF 305830]
MKTKKSSRKFAASGKLKQAIQARHKHQQIKKRFEGRRGRNGAAGKGKTDGKPSGPLKSGKEDETDEEEDVVMEERRPTKKTSKANAVESDEEEEQGTDDNDSEGEEDSEDDGEEDDEGSFSSFDEDEEGAGHLLELSKLAEKDPEFYKYLQENDKELLEFNANEPDVIASDEEMETGIPSEDEGEEATPVLKPETLKTWQKALLEHRSLRALRKLLLAFRAAAYGNDDDAVVAWSIDSSEVFDKVVTTALKYTPMVLDHHIPYRALPEGRYKPPLNSPKQQSLTRLISSFFKSILHLLSQITNPQMVTTCLTDSAKLVPYIVGNRKIVKSYVKTCLALWSAPNIDISNEGEEESGDNTAEADKVRIAAFLSMRRVAIGNDEALLDLVLKGAYTTLVKTSRSTNVHSLPAINLMKNTAVDLYSIDQAASYQHAFGYIRQLAVTLRNTLKAKATGPKEPNSKEKPKAKSKEPFKQVYNWQFVHSVDFWSMLLSRSCEKDPASELQPLIYPLVQVTLGAVKLVPTPRYYPLHLHLLRSLLTLSHHTHTYIPLPPYLIPLITSLASTQKPKSSTLKPLDLEVIIRAPTSYLKTRIFIDGIVEEALYLVAEWCADVQNSVAFPEIMVPIVLALKRCLKNTKQKGSGKANGKGGGGGDAKSSKSIKTLVERIEEGMQWTKEKRRTVSFTPNDRNQVDRWEAAVKIKDTPLGKYAAVLKKARERNRAMLEKARQGQDEYLDE